MLSFLKNFFIVFFLVILFNSQVQAGHKNYKLRTVEKVLSNLYRAASVPQIHKPKIALVKGSSIGAVYVPGQNLIRIEEKLYDICVEFNKDSLNALAFVISHELSHAIQKHVKFSNDASNFLMTNNMGKSKFHEEKEADLQGAFICYLAGYNPSKVLKNLINSIYDQYKLKDEILANYPPKSERINSSDSVLEMANELYQLFECANILIIQAEYKLADLCYRYILKKYQGAEIYNNLGLVSLYLAFELHDEEKDYYAYPFELDLNSNLTKIKRARGPISEEDRIIRKRHIVQAVQLFEKSLELNPEYSTAAINLICALNLEGNYLKAVSFYNQFLKTNRSLLPDKLMKLKMAVGISFALQQQSSCLTYFKSVIKSPVLLLKHMAYHNINIFNNCLPGPLSSEPCLLKEPRSKVDDVILSLYESDVRACVLDDRNGGFKFLYRVDGHLIRYQFQAPIGPVFSIQRHFESSLENLNYLPVLNQVIGNSNTFYAQTPSGNYLHCKQTEFVYLLDRKGNIVEKITARQY